ncbi:MAG: excinuclease ABC subunit UvrA [Cyclobacteriaceae bacterium]|nr:excinuclease ABC subunit UvrA [Cyclobacteriaceae bacterium]
MQTDTLATLENIDQLDPKRYILIKGARVNNLKSLSVAIPRNQLVVITGLSGSGKSSLAFDTLFAEGQRMYVESLSAYARQFLGRMEKPEVDYIKGISPAIAIEQKPNTRNPRSTVGTSTEIYDYLKLLFARIGLTYSPISGEVVSRDTVSDVVDNISQLPPSSKFVIACPLVHKEDRSLEDELKVLLQKGFTRILVNGETFFIEEILQQEEFLPQEISILIDRGKVVDDEDERFRWADSAQTAFFEGDGFCHILDEQGHLNIFSDRFERDGITFQEPTSNLFSFNNPYGACSRCEGFGKILGIDENLVVPNQELSVFEGAIAAWRSETMKKWLRPLLNEALDWGFPIHRAYNELSVEQVDILWNGYKNFKGIHRFFKHLESRTHKIQYRVLLSRYRGRTVCPDCRGSRLRKDASYVKIQGTSITDLVLMSVEEVINFFKELQLEPHHQQIARRILVEIENRLSYLSKVGLGYLNLNRLTSTLSGGEYQRIRLATSLGSALVGSMYILDEPSIGLHPRDTQQLIEVISSLRDLGNSVIVVEHDEEIMRASDYLIDIGPDAGTHGGKLVFHGRLEDLTDEHDTHTARFLNGTSYIAIPAKRRKWKDSITLLGARAHNLKNLQVQLPLNVLNVVTGVSGSGKSTLIRDILYPALSRELGLPGKVPGSYDQLQGDLDKVTQVELIDHNPIGKSSRSNPVTYVKAYDTIRQLFAEQGLAQQRGYKPSQFSFNVDGGRCENCQGEGLVQIEMQFMADLQLTCESCGGKRFKEEILEVKYKDRNIADVLEMTVEESLDFFKDHKTIVRKLSPLHEVGLGYITLGQSSNSLSGGEAQRVKLASFLGKGKSDFQHHVLFIFDEPTTGLHFHDIEKLLTALNALVEQGNTVIVIEHNLEIIKCADWLIDLGPEGGDLGGNICFAGIPEELVKVKDNHTAMFLAPKLS